MRNTADLRRWLSRSGLVLLVALATGCAGLQPPLVEEPAGSTGVPEPVVAEPPPPPSPPPRPASAARPPVTPARIDVALVVDPTAAAHAGVADEVDALLPPSRYRVRRASTDSLAEVRATAKAVVAVGRTALEAVLRDLPNVPVVFCQVLRPDDAAAAEGPLWGVASWPPAAVSLAAWRSLDPNLRTIMLIVSEAHSPMVADAAAAARAHGLELRIEESQSDRETLYLFRRFAASVDGLWLLPDERALGPTTLLELVRYAAAREIGVLGFSESLLPRGALLSATSVPEDVAAAVQRVVDRVAVGRTADLPAVTPLTAAALSVNAAVAADLGLAAPRTERWITREFD
jgi:ABC-type uncharacterized transport system substrate-binding protein